MSIESVTIPMASVPANQPVVDYLMEEAEKRENPYAKAAYQRAARKVAGADFDLFEDKEPIWFNNKAYIWGKLNLGPKTSMKMIDFIYFYPLKLKFEKTNDINLLIPSHWHGTTMASSLEILEDVAQIIINPKNQIKNLQLYNEIICAYYSSGAVHQFNVWEFRLWLADKIKKYIEKQRIPSWCNFDKFVELNSFKEKIQGPHHKLVIKLERESGEILWLASEFPLYMDDGKPWDFTVRTVNYKPSSEGLFKDMKSLHLFALETIY